MTENNGEKYNTKFIILHFLLTLVFDQNAWSAADVFGSSEYFCLIVSTVLRFSFLETVPCDSDENELFMHANDEDNDFNFYWILDLSWEMKKTSGTVGQADGWVRNTKQARSATFKLRSP